MRTDGKMESAIAIGTMAIGWGAGLALLPIFGAPAQISILVVLFLGLSTFALLQLHDRKARVFIARTLRKKQYTHFYSWVSGRVVGYFWPRLCDEVADDESLWANFRAALTWRLYERALLIAVVYPTFLLVGLWIALGQDGRLGNVTVLEATGFWPERAATLSALALIMISPLLAQRAAGSPKIFLPARKYFFERFQAGCPRS